MNKAGIVLAVSLMFGLTGSVRADEPSLAETFAKMPAALAARLSPDGKRVALIATFQGRQVLYVHSLEEGGKDGKIVRTEGF